MGLPVNDPELRCLICDRTLADGSASSLPYEKCGQCGKSILALGDAVVAEVMPLVRPVEIPTVSPVKPPPIPEVLPKAKIVPQAFSNTNRPSSNFNRTDDLPDPEPPKPKLAFALFVAFLTLLAIMASLTVIGYAIITGLKKAAKRVENPPAVRITTSPSTGR